MASLNISSEPVGNFGENDLSSMRKKLTQNERDTNEMSDVEFAQYQLAIWGHRSSTSHILEVVTQQLVDEEYHGAPSIQRLRDLMSDPRYDLPVEDPFAEQFENARYMASTAEQVFALDSVRRLHRITQSGLKQSNESTASTIDPHVRTIVVAILAANDEPATSK